MRDLKKIKDHLSKFLSKDKIIIYHLTNVDNILELVLLKEDYTHLSMDEVVYYTPLLSQAIDEVDDSDESYLLDIYSPITIPLFTKEQFMKVIGKKVSVETKDQIINGELEKVEDLQLIIKKKSQIITINLNDVKQGFIKENN